MRVRLVAYEGVVFIAFDIALASLFPVPIVCVFVEGTHTHTQRGRHVNMSIYAPMHAHAYTPADLCIHKYRRTQTKCCP